MDPIRFFSHRDTVWYNLTDYVQLLLDSHTVQQFRPIHPGKRRRQPVTIQETLLSKMDRLKPTYQLLVNGDVYADWVILEHLNLLIKPFFIQPGSWTDPDSIFRQLQYVINQQEQPADQSSAYFKEIQPGASIKDSSVN